MPTIVIRSRLARAGAVLTAWATACVVAYVWWVDGLSAGVTATGWALLLLVVVWSLWWAPDLVLREQGLEVRNTWMRHEVDWPQLEQCRSRWFLEVVLKDGGVVRAAAAPRAGGLRSSWHASRSLGQAPGTGREHRSVPHELLEPSDQVRRTSLDCLAAGDLIEAYATRLEERRRLAQAARSGGEASAQDAGAGALGGGAQTQRPAVRHGWRPLPVLAAAAGLGLLLLGRLLA